MKLLLIALYVLILSPLYSQELDTSMVGWSCRVKRTSRTEMEVRITGHIVRGYTIGLLEAPTLREREEMVNAQTTLSFRADSNWHVDAQNTNMHANKYKGDSWTRTVTRIDSVNKAIPIYVNVGGQKRQAAISDSDGQHLQYKYIPKVERSTIRYITYRVWGTVRMRRSLTLQRSILQQSAAEATEVLAPTLYEETNKDKKRRLKVNKLAEKSYKSRYPICIDARIAYYVGGSERYYIISIPFRNMPLKKWVGVHISELD